MRITVQGRLQSPPPGAAAEHMEIDHSAEGDVQLVQGPSTSQWVTQQHIHESNRSLGAIRYAAPTVPRKAHSAFSDICSEALQRVAATTAGGGQAAQDAQQELLHLPSRILHSIQAPQQRSARQHD
jgi:hypothetical protein